MPEFTVKELHLPELHLPEIKRDEIVRSLAGIRLPEVDMARAKRAMTKVPPVALTSADVGRIVAIGAAVARSVRPAPSRAGWLTNPFGRRSRSPIARLVTPRPSRSRWLIALGAIAVAAFGAWSLLRRPAVRQGVDDATRRARVRFDEWRALTDAQPVDAPPEMDAQAAIVSAPDADGAPTLEETGARS